MIYQTLKSAIQQLVETKVITQDRHNAVYNWVHKRLSKKGINSVTYELSDSQKITITRDTTTYCYSVEVTDSKLTLVTQQPAELEPVKVHAHPVQLTLFDHLEVDPVKAEEYARKHKRVRRPRLVIDNSYRPQLEIQFTFKPSSETDALADNVISLCEARQKRQPKVQQYSWGWQYLFDKTGF